MKLPTSITSFFSKNFTKQPDTFEVLLYYKYVDIADPEQVRIDQLELCQRLGLKGRIIIAEEGINGTVEGFSKNTKKYMKIMQRDKRFADIKYKRSIGNGTHFPRLRVRVRPEIVSAKLGADDLNPNELTGDYLPADQLHQWYEEGRTFKIVDMRNDYEFKVGHFDGAIDSKMRNFRELPEKLTELETNGELNPDEDIPVVTYCTGGVRCEKASGYLKKRGYKNVYQLHDGNVTYMEQFPNQHFKGTCFVFDDRKTLHFDESNQHEVIAVCDFCSEKSEGVRNCGNPPCNQLYIGCSDCVAPNTSRFCVDCMKVFTLS